MSPYLQKSEPQPLFSFPPPYFTPNNNASMHSTAVLSEWRKLQGIGGLDINGSALDIARVVAVSRSHVEVALSSQIHKKITAAAQGLQKHLDGGKMVYGVNTGFGGSADTRTDDHNTLQRSIVQFLNSGTLSTTDTTSTPSGAVNSRLPFDHDVQSMPSSWVKGAMLVRCNSLVRGHSGVEPEIIEAIITLLNRNIIPVVPLRGSISASGDLSPLSYIAATLQGNADVFVQIRRGSTKAIMASNEVLKLIGRDPLVLGPKEGLGLVNGTAFSATLASLVLHEANQLAVMSQCLTAMATEALCGQIDNYHPFISSVRPHRGQTEAAQNILKFLNGSGLARRSIEDETRLPSNSGQEIRPADLSSHGLAQDRYALRTAPQWIGPQLEDLLLAQEQVTVELNSTTDNPLIDASHDETRCYNGGNFQATSITSAMEKTRNAVQMLGKMLFAQCTELINPMLNNGLPANLTADDPSVSSTFKGVDINMAAYMSELAFLANPVSSHVQSAEMHNQALNSLALISARKTMEAVGILSLMTASYLYALCQALDLRAMQTEFLKEAKTKTFEITVEHLGCHGPPFNEGSRELDDLCTELWKSIDNSWSSTTILDLEERCQKAVACTSDVLLQLSLSGRLVPGVQAFCWWQRDIKKMLQGVYNMTRSRYFESHAQLTPNFLGEGSTKIYSFVRSELGIPMHKGLVDAPSDHNRKRTIGSLVSSVYEAIRDGRLHSPVMELIAGNAI